MMNKSMMNKSMFTSNTNEWSTPKDLFVELDNEFHFTLDPCSTHENAKCKKHFTIEDDGLSKSWKGEVVFCNPPYGRQINKWVEKAYQESLNGEVIILLIPSKTDTKYWHNYIFGKANIRFIKGRLKFGDSINSAPFPSAIIIYNKPISNHYEIN